jgi:hypothetical protein
MGKDPAACAPARASIAVVDAVAYEDHCLAPVDVS